MRSLALVLLALLVGGAAAGRSLQGPSPTEKLAADRQRQQEAGGGRSPALTPTQQLAADRQRQQEEASKARAASTQSARLRPPCFVPTSFYPYQTCGVSQDAATCARGYLAWPSMAQCCAPQRGALGAFKTGCTDLSRNVTCWVVGTYFPTQTCAPTTDVTVCLGRNWGRWASETDCCAPGRAHADGCSRSQPCWVASAFHPERQCGEVQDDAVCLRGWGAFGSEEECCMPGNGHSQGCGAADDSDQL